MSEPGTKGRTLLMLQYSANRDGSAFSGLVIAEGFKEAGWRTVVCFGHHGPMIEEYIRRGHDARVLPHRNWLRTTSWLRLVRNLWREWRAAVPLVALVRGLRPSVIYVNTGASLAGAIAAWRVGCPRVWHLRELFSSAGGELRIPKRSEWLFRYAFRRLSDVILAPSRAVAQNLLGRQFARVHLVPNAVDEAFFDRSIDRVQARNRFNLPANGIVLGVPGTLRPMKGHEFLLRALPLLVRRTPNLVAAITGSGRTAYAEMLRTLVVKLEIAHAVRFVGSVEDMPAFLATCDLVCIPSRSEPFGRTVIEAFAAGVPVVASAVDGILETVEDDENGLLVGYGDVEALIAAISRVIEDEALRDRLRSSAREKAEANFRSISYQRTIQEIVDSVLPDSESKKIARPAH